MFCFPEHRSGNKARPTQRRSPLTIAIQESWATNRSGGLLGRFRASREAHLPKTPVYARFAIPEYQMRNSL
eukprot:1182362-Prorocentrum_minimum.AAC.1